jgi:hypothetical protein
VLRLCAVFFILTVKPVRVDRGDGTAVLRVVLLPRTTANQVVKASVVRKLSGVNEFSSRRSSATHVSPAFVAFLE